MSPRQRHFTTFLFPILAWWGKVEPFCPAICSIRRRCVVPGGPISHPTTPDTPIPLNPRPATNTGDADLFETLSDKFSYEGRIPSAFPESYRCGYVSLVGAPNMGKSTLLNALISQDLCVATPRPQTTRHAILGILTTPTCQICFTDTPGVIGDPAYKLQEGMMDAVRGAYRDGDVLVVVTDLFSTPIQDDALFEKVRDGRKAVVVVVNKIDLVDKVGRNKNKGGEDDGVVDEEKTVTVPDAVAKWRSLIPNSLAVIPVTATDGPDDVGVTALRTLLRGGPDVPAAFRALGRPIPGMFQEGKKTITDEEAKKLLPESPPLYGQDTLTDRTERFFASEIIRASLFRKLGKELPYCCEVKVTQFKEPRENDPKPVIRMKATIYVERESQKGIVVGKGGSKVKEVGTDARLHLEDFLQTKVHLDLSVKVDKNWRRDETKLKAYGYLK